MQCVNLKLGKYALDIDNLDDVNLIEKINRHLLECKYCKELSNEYKSLVKDIQINPSIHPKKEKLIASISKFSEIKLPEIEINLIRKHIDKCRNCQTLIEQIQQSDKTLESIENEQELTLPSNWTSERKKNLTKSLMEAIHNDGSQSEPLLNESKKEEKPTTEKNKLLAQIINFFRLNPAWGLIVLVMFATIPISIYLSKLYKAPEILRGSNEIKLITPKDDTSIKTYQEFTWQSIAGAESYEITFKEFVSGNTVLQKTLKNNSYTLTNGDAIKFTKDTKYIWYVSIPNNPQIKESLKRTFTFTKLQTSSSYKELNDEDKRQQMLDKVLNGDETSLKNFINEANGLLKSESFSSFDRAWVLYVRSIALYYIDKHTSALDSIQQAIKIWENEGFPDEKIYPSNLYARALINLALFAQDSGNLNISFKANNKAISWLKDKSDKKSKQQLSTCYLNYGTLYRTIGLPYKALDSYRKALKIDREFDDKELIADELTNIGNIYVDELEDPKRGVEIIQEAAQIHEKLLEENNNEPARNATVTFDGLGVAYRKNGEFTLAKEYFDKAIKIDTDSKIFDGVLATTINKGNLLFEDLNDDEAARLEFEKAVKLVYKYPELDPDFTWRAFDSLGRVQLKKGDFENAEKNFLRAINISDEIRNTLIEKQTQRAFSAKHSISSYGLALLHWKRKDSASFFDTVEQARALSLRYVKTSTANAKSNLTLKQLQSSLKENQAALIYLSGSENDAMLLFVIMQNDIFWYELEKLKQITPMIRQTINSFSLDKQDLQSLEISKKLSETLLPRELISKLQNQNAKQLLVSLDGELHNLPLEALPFDLNQNESEPLIKHFRITNIPSFRWIEEIKKKNELTKSNFDSDALVIANPLISVDKCQSSSTLIDDILLSSKEISVSNPFPATIQEADNAISYASRNSLILSSKDLNSERFSLLNLNKYRIIHFATHGFAGNTSETSGLLFGCNDRPDILTGTEITKLSLSSQLVILSACETSFGSSLVNEGNTSLAWSFLVIGARNVVATRWKIKDNNPIDIMEYFYQGIAKGLSVDESLHNAKLKYLDENNASVRDWAAFATIGFADLTIPITTDESKLNKSNFPYVLLIISLLILAGFFILMIKLIIRKKN